MRALISKKLTRNDRLLNVFHIVGLAHATSQTMANELDCLRRHAAGRRTALEIGTRQGVAAGVIVSALAPSGRLYCIDPWCRRPGGRNWSYDICMRHFRRLGIKERVTVIREFSKEAESHLPAAFDFIFVDGDHSWDGIATDWAIVERRLSVDGIVCLHDTTAPASEPHRTPESCRFFQEKIVPDPRFKHLETCESMNVLRRIAQ